MKLLLAILLLCLLTRNHTYAQAWPRNPTTGKVELCRILLRLGSQFSLLLKES